MIMKRVFSFVLAFVMLLSLIPAVRAAEETTLNLSVNGLLVTHGATMAWDYGQEKLLGSADGASITWQANGNQLIVVAAPGDEVQSGATLTFKNELDYPATLRFKYTLTNTENFAEIRDSEGPLKSEFVEKELANGESYTVIVVSPDPGETPATLTITDISLSAGGNVTTTFRPAENGSYMVDDVKITEETSYEAPIGTVYRLEATANPGYQFFGWYNGTEYLPYGAQTTLVVDQDQTIWPVFIAADEMVFSVGVRNFTDLTEADTYAKESGIKTIVLTNDGTLIGEHTISAGNTLLIPFDEAATLYTEAKATASQNNNPAWETPRAFRTLTMAPGAKLTIQGSLNVGGMHSAGANLTAGSPTGDLGMIRMVEGANITVDNGGILYCWGYIYGDGTVTVKDGGTVHENFQFTDFRGGTATLGIAQSFIVFPMSQYYVQNVEVAMTFEHGASEYVWGSVYMSSNLYGTAVKFIGDDPNICMFVPGENGTVTKTYDPTTDRLIIDVDGDGSINPMGLELGGMVINTATFVLPINSNMTINVNSGITNLNQSLALLPGSVLNIAEGATLAVQSAEPLKKEDGTYVHYTGGNNLIVYDRDQWFNAYQPVIVNGQLVDAEDIEAYFVYTNKGAKRLQPVAYSPTRSYTRTEENLQDAVVDINGTLITNGFIYTTVDIDLAEYFFNDKNVVITGGGAAVKSSNGTGKLVMNNGAGYDAITLQPVQGGQEGTEVEFAYIPMSPARLMNQDGEYIDTMGAVANTAYTSCALCGGWYSGELNSHMVEITWIVDGVASTQEICAGTKPVYNAGNDPVKEGYTFIGWSTGNDNEPEYTSATLPDATTDATYWACFEQKATGLLGDLNLDGLVNSDDLTLLARHVGKIEFLSGQALANADVNGDGEVDSDDLTKHARYVGKIISDWSQN